MDQEGLIAALSLLGSLFGTLSGVVLNSRLVNYRLNRLEQKMDQYNKGIDRVSDRVYALEKQAALAREGMRVINRRLSDLEVHLK